MSVRKNFWRGCASLAGLALFISGSAWAGVVVSGTRVVYPGASHQVTVHLSNEGKTPELVETWLDAGNAEMKPEDAQVPFILTPPVFRLDPSKGQSLKIMYTQEPLPQDKETVFWLNVLEIPPKDPSAQANSLALAFRTRIKVFFRPAGLKGDPGTAAQQLHWKILPAQAGQAITLQCDNPTPYAVSFNKVALQADGKDIATAATTGATGMVKPGTSLTLKLNGLNAVPTGALKVDYAFIDDNGAIRPLLAPLQ